MRGSIPHFAKEQLVLFLREWYMHPNGQIPAYEFAFGDVNPPVHAWACWRVYKMTGPHGQRDRLFLARAFQKLLINFTWWVNRKDADGKHLFAGGFLGLDNIGVFDRSKPLPTGGHLEQADGTAWMAFYCATMLAMALELASEDPAYEDVASKFFEHFVAIADAMNTLGGTGLWDEEDGFYYDQLHVDGTHMPLRIRSLVGLIPLFAVEVLEERSHRAPAGISQTDAMVSGEPPGPGAAHHLHASRRSCRHRRQRLLAIPSRERLERVLRYLLDENEFLSPVRHSLGLAAASRDSPYVCSRSAGRNTGWTTCPGESNTGLFGGNSNWRGPIWFPVNYLLIEALERYHHFYGDRLQVECPTGSGRMMNLQEVARGAGSPAGGLFLPDAPGRRPCHGDDDRFADDPALARSGAVPRVFPRRHRPRRRRQSSDRLDRAGRALHRGSGPGPDDGSPRSGPANRRAQASVEPPMNRPIAMDEATEWLEADGLGGFASGTTAARPVAITRCCSPRPLRPPAGWCW